MGFWQKKQTPPKPLPNEPVVYPAGVCVVDEGGNAFLINKDGKRYRILTDRIRESWNFPVVVHTSARALRNYPIAVTKLAFRDGTLLNNVADGRLYLASGGVLRHVVSPDVLDRLGLAPADAWIVSQAEINIMKQGDELT